MAASKLGLEGRVSISAFLAGLSVIIIPLIRTWFGHIDWVFDYLTEMPGKIAICMQVAVVNGLLLLLYRGPVYKVSFHGNTLACFSTTDDFVLEPWNASVNVQSAPVDARLPVGVAT